MALAITTTRKPLPPRILLYGPGGIGKTTFAASIPRAVIMPVEEGADALDAARLPTPMNWSDALAQIDSLAQDQQGFGTLAIDSVTALQDLCYAQVCTEHNVGSIEAVGYGKGYVRAGELWRDLLSRLNAVRQRMVVLLIGHSATRKHEDPRLPAYDRLTPRLQVNGQGSGLMPMTVEWCDVVACAAYQIFAVDEKAGMKERSRAVGEGERTLYVQERPAYLAKNRYGLPPELPFTAQALLDGIRAALRPAPPVSASDKAA